MQVVVHQSTPSCLKRAAAEMCGADRDSEPARMGSAIHSALEAAAYASEFGEDMDSAARAALVLRQPGERPLSNRWLVQAQEILDGALSDHWMRGKLRGAGSGRAVRVEWTWCLDSDFEPVLKRNGEFVEHERHNPTDERVAYSGTIDRVEFPISEDAGPVVVSDYKSGLAWVSKDDIASDTQAMVYSFATLCRFPAQPRVVWETWHLRERRIVRHEFVRGESWQARARTLLLAKRARLLEAVRANAWPADIGPDCQYCPIRGRCEEFAAAVADGLVEDEGPERTVRRAIALKPLAAALGRQAESLAREQSFPIEPGKSWGFFTKERPALTLPVTDVIAELRGYGATDEDLREAFPGDRVGYKRIRTLLDKLAARDEDLVGDPKETIKSFYEPETYQTVGVHPAEIVEE